MEKRFIKKAIKDPGALHRALKIPKENKIPENKLLKAEKSNNPKIKKMAILAETLKKLRKKNK